MGADGSSGQQAAGGGDGAKAVAALAAPPPRPRMGIFKRLARFIARFSFRVRLTALGVAATAVIVVLDILGLIAPIERPLYDLRARTCQFGRPTTVPFVHLDIDEASLEAIDKWPWPRRVLAAGIDEMLANGAKRVALDLIFPEKARRPEWVATAETITSTASTRATTVPAGNAAQAARRATEDEDDQLMADAVARAKGRVFLPVRYVFPEPGTQPVIEMEIRSVLRGEPAMEPAKVTELVVKRQGEVRRADVERIMRDSFINIRQEVFLDVMLTPPRRTREQQREMILGPRATTRPGTRSPIENLLEKQLDKAEAIWALWDKFPRDVEQQGDLLATTSEEPPIETLARNSGGYGFVNYINDDDGIVRSVPLVVNHRGRIAPQFALALACLELGVRPDYKGELEIEDDRITLRPPGGQVRVIPVYTARQRGGRVKVGASFAIPFWGGRDWQTMFKETASGGEVRHVPFTMISKVLELRFNRDANRRRVLVHLNALRTFDEYQSTDERGKPVQSSRKVLPVVPTIGDDFEDRIEETLAEQSRAFVLRSFERLEKSGFAGVAPEQAEKWRTMLDRKRKLVDALADNRKMTTELATAREDLKAAVGGRLVIVGWAATGVAADFVPTPIHDKCAGVVLHGAIYNAIMTGAGMRVAPLWLTTALTLLLGLASVWVMVQAAPREGEETGGPAPSRERLGRLWVATQLQLSPTQATVMGVTLVVLWVFVNAIVLFGWRHYVLGLAAPLIAMLLVWSLGIAAIAAERFRVTQILRGYVDPKLVEYLKRNPEEALFRTRVQEVTVCFSDIQGFTSLTQLLGERMVPMLQDYLSRMVEVIRRNNGVVNKFMGDGIMYIFGVPEAGKENHAERALRCCLEMQEALVKFNRERMAPNGFPTLKMRIGVNTGIGYCGDAGPAEAREYTALGDTTNVAARLEPANKDVGTLILVADSTRRSVPGDTFFFRPVGKLKLRNRAGCIETHELVGLGSAATPKDRDHARLLEVMVRSFQSRMFDECLGFLNAASAEFGESKLCELYRRQCEELSRNGAAHAETFEGQVIGG
jgi:class 3 adenylate cyclase/CHASE2 domain-containing sensor protein